MWDFARENPGYIFIAFVLLVGAVEHMVVAYCNRNKPEASTEEDE
jgi:hypothetical protein